MGSTEYVQIRVTNVESADMTLASWPQGDFVSVLTLGDPDV
jgi:hypothetical protein